MGSKGTKLRERRFFVTQIGKSLQFLKSVFHLFVFYSLGTNENVHCQLDIISITWEVCFREGLSRSAWLMRADIIDKGRIRLKVRDSTPWFGDLGCLRAQKVAGCWVHLSLFFCSGLWIRVTGCLDFPTVMD